MKVKVFIFQSCKSECLPCDPGSPVTALAFLLVLVLVLVAHKVDVAPPALRMAAENVFFANPLDFRWFSIFYLKHLLPRFIISSCFFSPEPSVLYPWPVIPWRQVSTRFIGPLCFILWIKAQNRVGKYYFCNQLSAKLADESCAGKNKMWTFIGSCQRNILHCGLWRISQNSQMHDHM